MLLFLSAIRSSERALFVSARGPLAAAEDAQEDEDPVDPASDAAEADTTRLRLLSPSAGTSPLASWIVTVRPKSARGADAVHASSALCPNAAPATPTPSAACAVPTIRGAVWCSETVWRSPGV